LSADHEGEGGSVEFFRLRRPGVFTRNSVVSVVVFTAFGLLEGQADTPRDQDESRLVRFEGGFEGGWKVSSAVLGGTEIPEHKFEGFTIAFESCELTLLSKGTEVLKGQIKADPSTKPAELDYTPDGGPHKGMTHGHFSFNRSSLRFFASSLVTCSFKRANSASGASVGGSDPLAALEAFKEGGSFVSVLEAFAAIPAPRTEPPTPPMMPPIPAPNTLMRIAPSSSRIPPAKVAPA
jgi:uncharacterized protein (TIGR03067 family)